MRVWDPATGQPVGGPLTGHTGTVYGVCTLPGTDVSGHPDGRTLLATTGWDGTVRVWDPATGQAVGDLLTGHTGGVWGMCTVPGTDATGHPSGRMLLATGGLDGTVRVWDPATGQPVGDPLTGHTGFVRGVCPLPGRDGRTLLASSGQDGTVRVWDPATGQPVGDPLIGHSGAGGLCSLPGLNSDGRPDGRALLAWAQGDGTVRVWDPGTGQPVGDPLIGHTGAVNGVCTLPGTDVSGHPDGRTLLATTGRDGTVRVWDPATGRPIGAPLSESPACINALAAQGATDADCLTLAADGTIRSWTSSTASLATIPTPAAGRHTSAIAVHTGADGDILLTGDTTGVVHTTDLATHRPLHPPVRIDDGAVLALCPVPGQPVTIAAAGRSGTITLHSTTGTTPRRLSGHTGPVRTLCLIHHPDHPPLLASAGNDATIRVWNPTTATPHRGPLTGHQGWIWALTTIPPPTPDDAPYLASAGADATIRIWTPYTGDQIGQPLTGHTDQVRALTCATTPHGHTLLISGSHDGTLRLWHPTTGTPVRTIPLGTPIHALLPQPPTPRSRERTNNGATLTVGLRTGILTLDINSSLFPPHPYR